MLRLFKIAVVLWVVALLAVPVGATLWGMHMYWVEKHAHEGAEPFYMW